MMMRPPNERERLQALHQLRILDTGPEPHYDAVCALACDLFRMPVALIAFMDEGRQWFKARRGTDLEGTDREVALCHLTLLQDGATVVENLPAHPHFASHPLVVGEPRLRFYAGVPLSLEPGLRLGTLCILDTKPRHFTDEDRAGLERLAEVVVAHLRLHQANQTINAELLERQARERAMAVQARELRRREAMIAQTETLADLGTWELDLDSREVTWSDNLYRIYDRPVGGPVSMEDAGSAYEADDLATIRAAMAALASEGRPFDLTLPFLSAAGRRRIVGNAEMVDGKPKRAFGIVQDITDAKNAEEELQETAQRLTATLETMDQGLVMVDAARHVQIANRRALELLDLPAELMARKPHQDEVRAYQIAAGEFSRPSPALQHWLNTAGLTTDHPVYLRERPNGTVLEIRTAPLPGGGAVRTFTDVTERQRWAEEVTQAKNAAEDAQARAELANRAKGEFLASMSHEVRTPLNGILGYAELLIMSGRLEPEQRQHVERIQSAGSALLTVVDDVLDFAQIEAGEVRLEPLPFSPEALLGDAVSIVRSVADRKGIAVDVTLDGSLPPLLLGDEARLRQVLLNLLNNAVKFTRQGSVTVEAAASGAGPEAYDLTFKVRDTGIGIPPDRQARLFQRFSQVDGSIRREFGGTGLGLAISKELIDRMGGTIGASSEEGRGSVFWFTVRLPRGVRAAEPDSRGAATPGERRPARILLVEDIAVNQDLARAVLEAAGHAVDVVPDGAQAVAAVQERAYDLVLMDVQMPVMDGITATREIRALEHPARGLPIIAMTANVLPQQITAYKEAGMTDHVGKPFKRQDLYAAVERAMISNTNPVIQEIVDGDGPVLDRAILAELMEVGGAPMVQRLLDQFAANYAARFADQAPAQVARDAHALVSSAGMLGLTRLSQACARLEAACEVEADVSPLLTGVRAEAEAALAAAAAWRSEAA
ncbi:MAG TPA: ATP-binding protein [Microvirga sp.]|jgi:signal transduction histidine kinase/CheY-like chemotaxis protein/HPt (histidine-containing phosphotransfer) domain-containing protein|nr:ATP-binding protein [Microvirga sp.]